MQVDMKTLEANARKGTLSLSFGLPDAVKIVYFTDDELVRLLKRGGVTLSLESSLVRRAFQHAPSELKLKFQSRPQEEIPGLGGRHRSYRFVNINDTATPASQRVDKPPTVPENFFLDDEKYKPHLEAILKYYANKNSGGGRSSTATAAAAAAAPDRPNVTGKQLNGKRMVVEIEQLYCLVQSLHRSCGSLYLSTEPKRTGFGVTFEWRCDRCNEVFPFRTWIGQRSVIVCPGRKHSRTQAGMNLELQEAAEDEAMFASRSVNFWTKADIVHPTEKNAREMEKKCRAAAIEAADEVIDENRANAYAASTKTVEFKRGGETYLAAAVTVAQDGSALKRDYGHHFTGSAAAQVAVEKETGLVVDKRKSQASCIRCQRAYNDRMREKRMAGHPLTNSDFRKMTKDEILALYAHDGPCSRNSSYSPGVAEEHLAEKVGKNLLVDEEGSVQACPLFVEKHIADGDSKGITRAAAAQKEIVGDEVASNVELCRDYNHLSGSVDSEWRKILKEEKSQNAVASERLSRMKTDLSLICDRYKNNVLDQPNVSEDDKKRHLATLLSELQSVVRHQAGIHTYCTTNTCDWKRLSIANPDWNDAKLDEKWSAGNQFGGEILEISDDTIAKMTLAITKRINKKSADSNCKKESTTGVEQVNGMFAKFTGGKRINLTGADGYDNALSRGVGHKSLGTEFNNRVLGKLGSAHSPSRDAGFDGIARKLDKDLTRKKSDKYKKSKSDSKRLRAALRNRSEKDDKDHKYRKGKATAAGKVRPEKSGRKKIDQQCGKCKQFGHTRADCMYDDADNVVLYAGKKRKKSGPTSTQTKKKAKANFGVSVSDISSWMPSVLRENGSL